MKKRRAETLVEFLVATAIFGTMMIGVCNFIANQTQTLVNIRHRDDFMYYANLLRQYTIDGEYNCRTGGKTKVSNRNLLHNVNHNIAANVVTTQYYEDDNFGNENIRINITELYSPIVELEKIVKFDWDKDTHILTVKKGDRSMSFNIAPSD